MLGDSLISYGQNAHDSFGQRLKHHLSGLRVRILGTSGYGPFQYLQVLKTYGIKKNPRYAIFSFNEGNDIEDIHPYLQWKNGAVENLPAEYQVAVASFHRYIYALSGTSKLIRRTIWDIGEGGLHMLESLAATSDTTSTNPDLAWVHLPGINDFPEFFIEKQRTENAKQIASTLEWKKLREVLDEFKTICSDHDVVPIIMFIPTVAHLYAEYTTNYSGKNWLRIRNDQIRAKSNVEDALTGLAGELRIPLVSLSTPFAAAVRSGKTLHYPLSVHLNSEGSEIAATYVAGEIKSKIFPAGRIAVGQELKLIKKSLPSSVINDPHR